jgi:hypothetical protein
LGFAGVAAIPDGPITLVSTGEQEQDARQRRLEEAKGVAEVKTGGEAVAARWVSLGGTDSSDGLGGIEVLVQMPGKSHGWRCIIDSNNMKLRRKETIPNLASKVREDSRIGSFYLHPYIYRGTTGTSPSIRLEPARCWRSDGFRWVGAPVGPNASIEPSRLRGGEREISVI